MEEKYKIAGELFVSPISLILHSMVLILRVDKTLDHFFNLVWTFALGPLGPSPRAGLTAH